MIELIPPQSLETEQAILGAMLVQQDIAPKVFTLLQPEHFYKKQHETIFRAMRKLYQQTLPIDILSVTDQLKKDRQIDNVGGPMAVLDLSTNSSPVLSVEHHCLIIHQQYLRRKLGQEGHKIHLKTFDDSEDVFDLLDSHSSEIIKLRSGMSNAKSKHVSSAVVQNKNSRETRREGGSVGIPTISEKLTKSIYGWENGKLYVIAARPGMGKSAYVLSEARNLVENHGKRVWVSTIEMSANEQTDRLLSNVANVPFWKLKSPDRMTSDEQKRVEAADAMIYEWPLWFDDRGSVSIMDIRSAAITQKQENNIDLIIIDYLQLISGNSKGNREQEVSEMSRAMKQIARELDVPVLLLSQLSRAVETRGGEKIPQLSDLRESGAIEQDADCVLFLYRAEYYKIKEFAGGRSTEGVAEIIVAKHRGGSLCNVETQFEGDKFRFSEPTEKEFEVKSYYEKEEDIPF